MSAQQPNILYLHTHDTGRYIQPYGHAIDTPNLQRLAEQGVLFRQAFCVSPSCSPSRAGLLTGRYPHENGMIGLANFGPSLHDPTQHLAHFLHRHGYETALAGVQHETDDDPRELGYERLLDDEIDVDPAIDWDVASGRRADAFFAQRRDRPFFLACGFMQTHRLGPWHSVGNPPAGHPRYATVPAPLPDTPETRQDFADYAVAAQQMDASVGQVLDALEAHGLAERTLVICTTDHGIAFPFMKCSLTDHGTGVMLMLRGPGPDGQPLKGGRVVDAMVSQLDVLPTLCDTLGVEPPPGLRGKSLAPLLCGQDHTLHEQLVMQTNYHASYEPARAVRTNRYKYIRRWNVLPHPVLPNCDDSISKDLLLRHGWRQQPQVEESLYDLLFDPNEAHNLAADADADAVYADVLDQMRGRLDRWMRETHDPARSGRIPPAPGAVGIPTDGLTPYTRRTPLE